MISVDESKTKIQGNIREILIEFSVLCKGLIEAGFDRDLLLNLSFAIFNNDDPSEIGNMEVERAKLKALFSNMKKTGKGQETIAEIVSMLQEVVSEDD